MAKKDIEAQIQKDREAVKSDKGFELLPLNTEEDIRRALRVVLNAVVDLQATIEALQNDKAVDEKTL